MDDLLKALNERHPRGASNSISIKKEDDSTATTSQQPSPPKKQRCDTADTDTETTNNNDKDIDVDVAVARPFNTNEHNEHDDNARSAAGRPPARRSRTSNKASSIIKRPTTIKAALLANLQEIDTENGTEATTCDTTTFQQQQQMEGDIQPLVLNSIFMQGVRIGWPYTAMMKPQRQMALHLISAFKNKRHVALESPTGTGKSAAILCTALAWQRYHAKMNGAGGNGNGTSGNANNTNTNTNANANANIVKIIYCSRTHSQVSQMVASMKKTPYRPRMAILGTRGRFCIHKGASAKKNRSVQVDYKELGNFCLTRVRNSEKQWKEGRYDDDVPPTIFPGDDEYVSDGEGYMDIDDNLNDEQDMEYRYGDSSGLVYTGTGTGTDDKKKRPRPKTCRHYRQLSSKKLAKLAHGRFVPMPTSVQVQVQEGCSCGGGGGGGEKTIQGAHDIEDLVAFGEQPRVKRGVAIYRRKGTGGNSNGSSNSNSKPSIVPHGLNLVKKELCRPSIEAIASAGAAAMEGSLEVQDEVLAINSREITPEDDLKYVQDLLDTDEEPLMVDTYSDTYKGLNRQENDEEAACPYFISRALATRAELIFCPYNYVLDKGIRNSLGIDIENSIIVIDEAHNIDGALRELGSGEFSEVELSNIVASLLRWSVWNPKEKEMKRIPAVAHGLAVFVEKFVLYLRHCRHHFESNQGTSCARKALDTYSRGVHYTSVEHELSYDGPPNIENDHPRGCASLFQRITLTQADIILASNNCEIFMRFQENQVKTDTDRLMHRFVQLICVAYKCPEHHYISTSIIGSEGINFVTRETDIPTTKGWKKHKDMDRMGIWDDEKKCEFCSEAEEFSRKEDHYCKEEVIIKADPDAKRELKRGANRHSLTCNGSTPRWNISLKVQLLSAGMMTETLFRSAHSVVLASGSMAPIRALCNEINLMPPRYDAEDAMPDSSENPDESRHGKSSSHENEDPHLIHYGRLQISPEPLEANHVINLDKQLLTASVGFFIDGSPLNVKKKNSEIAGFFDKLGESLIAIVEKVPEGGVLVFFPSFAFLKNSVSCWKRTGMWRRFVDLMTRVAEEPHKSSQAEFERVRDYYMNAIDENGKCILFAVFRGKMSEGISFNDNYARAVICVGIPYPSIYERPVSAKMAYNDEQKQYKNRNILQGREWYRQEAFRAVSQAIGRCIRHSADYGAIILLDSRYSTDNPGSRRNFPKWMRNSIRELRSGQYGPRIDDIVGGYNGLGLSMNKFFSEAKTHVAANNSSPEYAECSSASALTFDDKTGFWSPRKK